MEEHAGGAEFRVAYPAPDGVLITNRDSAVVAPTDSVSIADLSPLVSRGAGLQYFASLNVASAMTQLVRSCQMTAALPPPTTLSDLGHERVWTSPHHVVRP